jgi:uncharacterized protein (UPF0254 family)
MSTVLTIPCDSGLQKMLVVDDKYRDYLVISAEASNGQHDSQVKVVVSKHHAVLLRDQLNQFIGEPSKATIVAGIIRLYQQNNFDTDVLDQLMAICGEQ